jgi:peptide/nickel transport system permease protein
MLTNDGVAPTEELLQKKREQLGLNRPVYEQYLSWIANLLKGDMGVSIKSNREVSNDISEALPYTVLLAVSSMALNLIISVPVGIFCARHQNSVMDKFIQMISYVFISLPIFFISLVTIYIFSLKLRLLPVISTGSIKGLIMPTVALSLNMTAVYIKQIRAVVLREMNKDYVTGLYSRGISRKSVFQKHIFRNSLTYIITLIGMSFGVLLGGTIIVESIFSWPGVGKLAVEAIGHRDYPLIQGYMIWMAVIYFAVNTGVEILYKLLNPKTRRYGG